MNIKILNWGSYDWRNTTIDVKVEEIGILFKHWYYQVLDKEKFFLAVIKNGIMFEEFESIEYELRPNY